MSLTRHLRLTALLCAVVVAPALAQDGERATVPWRVGERFEYDVRFGKLHAGSASMEVAGFEEIRGRETWHTVFRVSGGVRFLYHIEDTFESWVDTRTLNSLRFRKDQNEGRRDVEHLFNHVS